MVLWLAGAVAMPSCSDEQEKGLPVVDGRGTWMLTVESEVYGSSYRLVATKLDSDLTVEIAQHQAYGCRGFAPDVIRIPGSHHDDIPPQILRLTPDGFVLEPDVLPEGVDLLGCPPLLTDEFAVLLGDRESYSADTRDHGLYLARKSEQGSLASVQIDAGTGPVGSRFPYTPDQAQLFYATDPTLPPRARSRCKRRGVRTHRPHRVIFRPCSGRQTSARLAGRFDVQGDLT